jgi:hypothetical protein
MQLGAQLRVLAPERGFIAQQISHYGCDFLLVISHQV